MKFHSVSRRLGLGVAAIVAAAALSAVAPTQAQDKMMAMKDRVATMKDNGKNLGTIGRMVKGEMAADFAVIASAASAINGNAMKLKGLFPEGSGGGESRALPAIWENKADVNAKLTSLAEASDALAKEAATGSVANLQASFGAIASTCGACHKAYRAEKN
jgi:cytochrome c556